MARLKALAPQLPILAPSSAPPIAYEQKRQEWEWRSWYGTARWKKLRWEVLVRDFFTCQNPECRKMVVDHSQLVADHITAHRGDEKLFWERSNLQTLCKECHDRVKQSEEKNAPQFGS